MSSAIGNQHRRKRLLNLSFGRDGSSVFWPAENAVEAVVVAGVHRTRGYDFLGATDSAGTLVAVDVEALQGVAEQESAGR